MGTIRKSPIDSMASFLLHPYVRSITSRGPASRWPDRIARVTAELDMNTGETFEWTSMLIGIASITVGLIRLLSYAAALAPLPLFGQVSSPVSARATAAIVLLGYGLLGLSRWRESRKMRLAVIGAALLAAIAPFVAPP